MFLLIGSPLSTLAQDGISRSPQGLLQVENLTFGLTYWSQDWSATAFQHKNPQLLTYLGEGGEDTAEGIRRSGTFTISEARHFAYEETVRQRSPRELTIRQVLTSAEGIPTAILALTTEMPISQFIAMPPLLDGHPIVYKPGTQREYPRRLHKLVVNLKQGRLTISGQVGMTVRFQQVAEIRFKFPAWGPVHKTELKLNFAYTPYHPTSILDLRNIVNMGFEDQIPDDRKGGWTDQGPDNDLSMIKTGRQTLAGIDFLIIDPAKNQGKSCLAMRGKARPYFRDHASISAKGIQGTYLYLLNGLAWAPPKDTPVGKIILHYEDGTTQEEILLCGKDTGNFWGATDLKRARAVWKSQNRQAAIGLYASQINLRQGKKLKSIDFQSMNQVWMILAASVSDMMPKAEVKQTVTLKPNQTWIPLKTDFKTPPGSIADLSFMLDPPAGKHGFLKVSGDHFEFTGRPGVPVRFWGTNVCMNALFSTKEDNMAMLDDIAASGYNAIRLHHFDSTITKGEATTGTFNKISMDQLDFLLAQAKKRGLYVTLDFLTIAHESVMRRFPQAKKIQDYKFLCYVNHDVRKAFADFAVKLMSHVNPYTGLAWKDDPMFITAGLINEGTLTARAIPPGLKPEVDKAFEAYLTQKGLPCTQENRKDQWLNFLEYIGIDFFRYVKTRLTDSGVNIPLSDQNFAGPALETRAAYDYVDTHLYWSHPMFIGPHPWQLPSYTNPTSAIGADAGGIRDVLHTRFFGSPMTVTEWGYCYPNPHALEGPFLLAAYAALQDYSGMWQFCYSHRGNVQKPTFLGAFDTRNHPVMKLATRAAALIFLRKDVKSATTAVAVSREAVRLLDNYVKLTVKVGRQTLGKKNPGITLIRTGQKTTAPTDGIVIQAQNASEATQKLIQRNLIPPPQDKSIIVSETGELILNRREKTFHLHTPRQEVHILGPKQTASGNVLTVKNGQAFAAIALISMDGKALTDSRRLLLLHLTDIKSRGAQFRDQTLSVLEHFGTGEQLLRKNKPQIRLKLTDDYRLYACAATGRRLCEIPLKHERDGLAFEADNTLHQGILVYELTRP